MKARCMFGIFAGLLICCSATTAIHAEETYGSVRSDRQAEANDALWFESVFPERLNDAAGREIVARSALKGKTVGVYFSAHWCGPCRGFTPQLVQFYNQVAANNDFEIVFVSSDRSADDMMKYMRESSMPWVAIPFGDPSGKALKRKLGINGIPTLVIYDSSGKIISSNGRWDVVMSGTEALNAWKSPGYKPKTYGDFKAQRSPNGGRSPASAANRAASKWRPGPTGEWHVRMDTALDAARREHKKILVLKTGSDWCGYCKKLYREVLSNSEFTDFARKKLILVYLDLPRSQMPESQMLYNRALSDALRFSGGVPSIIVLDENGRSIGRISGYRPLERFMPALRDIVRSRNADKKTPLPPRWVRRSPEQLAPMLDDLRKKRMQDAADAAKASEAVKGKFSFKIVAWGLDEDRVDRPFDPRREIKVPVQTRVYFRVRYSGPTYTKPKPLVFMRMPMVSYSSPGRYVSGDGEFVAMLAYTRPCRQNKIVMRMRLRMNESRTFDAAELPCRVVWE